MFKTVKVCDAFLLPFVLLLLCGLPSAAVADVACESGSPGCADARALAFRDAVSPPPEGWQGPVFELSHDYPTEVPGVCPKDVCGWLGVDVDFSPRLNQRRWQPQWKNGWREYMAAIKAYVRAGQDDQLRHEKGWQDRVDGEDRWFDMPWMAYDERVGREFVHGMTNERTAHIRDFVGEASEADGEAAFSIGLHLLPGLEQEDSKAGFETWAFGVYNPWGGWSIGRAIPNATGTPVRAEDRGMAVAAGLPFPEGTLVAKFLFTTATSTDVDYLEGAPSWQIDRHRLIEREARYRCEREPQRVQLVQVDVAVVDERSPTRWVYGTFVYDGTDHAESPWDRLKPLGLQWGSDPWTYPAVPRGESSPVRQSVLAPIEIYEHYGCDGRLAGPADNRRSSCLSCHGGAYAPPVGTPAAYGVNVPSIFGFPGLCDHYSYENVKYFQNRPYPVGADGGGFPDNLSLDTSLQLQVAFFQYAQYRTYGQPKACVDR